MRFLQQKFQPRNSLDLNAIVTHAYTSNPFYRQKLSVPGVSIAEIHRTEDLKKLPFTTREELAKDPWILLSVPRETVVQAHMSTGTSGRSSHYMFYDSTDLYRRGLLPLVSGSSSTKMLRIEMGDLVFNALPYEVSLTGMAVHRAVQDGTGACVVPLGKGGFYADPEKAVRIMLALEGDHLFTTPSYAVHLAETADRAGPDVRERIGLRSVWLIGELCSQALRKRIEELWGCPVFLYYGSMESGAMGIECSMHDGYHPASNVACIEIIALDDSTKEAPSGTLGEIVVTPLWRYASPLVRYRTGDLGRWDTTPCRCGLATPRLHVQGRVDDMVVVGDKKLHVLDIEDLLLRLPDVSSWFRIKAAGDELRVLLPEPGEGDRADARGTENAVREKVTNTFGVACTVERVPSPGYGGGKFLRVAR